MRLLNFTNTAPKLINLIRMCEEEMRNGPLKKMEEEKRMGWWRGVPGSVVSLTYALEARTSEVLLTDWRQISRLDNALLAGVQLSLAHITAPSCLWTERPHLLNTLHG
ncbi:hypothetical protein GW7_04533 [Heterocephalus glaber]|uniref:Uncharacterized protein n=1 Tax=Heterocephalus glaber TaxID=10181 RepID=G5BLV8_HETGA|nr:hypothetical protein GW7_04533 [Heterocephalus glaber]